MQNIFICSDESSGIGKTVASLKNYFSDIPFIY